MAYLAKTKRPLFYTSRYYACFLYTESIKKVKYFLLDLLIAFIFGTEIGKMTRLIMEIIVNTIYKKKMAWL